MVTRHRAAALVVALLLIGCAPYRPNGYAPRVVVQNDQPRKLRAILANGERVVLKHPEVVGDSLVGESEGMRVAIALDDVRQVETRRDESLWLILGVPILFYFGVVFLAAALAS